jgi:hypothetical protein
LFEINDQKEESRETGKISYDDYFANDDVIDLSQVTHQSSKNERYSNSENISFNPHFKAKDHSPDFADQDDIPIYDSYHEETPMPVHNHNLSSGSQGLASSCE